MGAMIASGEPKPIEWPVKQEAIVETDRPRTKENRQQRRKNDKTLHYTI